MRARLLICLLGLMFCLAGNVQAQSGRRLEGRDGDFWTLPTVECSGDNFCEIRVTPQGTIYSWDFVHFRLYVSPKNVETYTSHDLSEYSQSLVFSRDFVPFDNEGYVMFFSPVGASEVLTRYNMTSHTLDIAQVPPGHRLIGCNQSTQMRYLQLRYIYQLGSNGQLMACTDSPQGEPLIHIIDITTSTIQQTLDIDGIIFDVIQPRWVIAGGPNGKIYVTRAYNPTAVIPALPEIDETTEEFVLIYDVASEIWTYEIKPRENTHEILGILLDDTTLFQNYQYDGEREIIQFSADFQILRRFGLNAGLFLGVTTEGDIFFSTGHDNSAIVIANIQDFPLVEVSPNAGVPTPTSP